jgi:hypothetical protein
LPDVVGNAGTTPPAHVLSDVPKPNVGVILGVIVTVNVVVIAHNPDVGVNVYTAEFWLSITAGFHEPAIPLVEVVVSIGTAPFAQITRLVPKLNTGVVFGLTVTVNEVAVAHWPADGVNV